MYVLGGHGMWVYLFILSNGGGVELYSFCKNAHSFIILIFAEITHQAEAPTHPTEEPTLRAEDSARIYYSNNTLRPSSPSDP